MANWQITYCGDCVNKRVYVYLIILIYYIHKSHRLTFICKSFLCCVVYFFFCLVSWTYQSFVNLSWSILIKLVWHVWKRSTRTKQYCTNSSSTWLYMLPQDCSGFHRGRYIICWQLPFKNEFTTLAKKCRYSWREVSCSRARASEGSLVRACMLWTSSEIRATPWRWNADRELLSDFWQIILWFIKLSNIKINFDQLRRVLIMASVYGNEPRVRVTHILLIGICSVPNIRTCLPRISFYATF